MADFSAGDNRGNPDSESGFSVCSVCSWSDQFTEASNARTASRFGIGIPACEFPIRAYQRASAVQFLWLRPAVLGLVPRFAANRRKCLSMNNLQLIANFRNQGQSSLIKPNQG
jgi:hypothetical protein